MRTIMTSNAAADIRTIWVVGAMLALVTGYRLFFR